MDATKYNELLNYICSNVYPDDFSKIKKHGLRRLSKKFNIDGKGKKAQVIVGAELAKKCFNQVHSLLIGGHSGINKTKKSIGSRFYWPNMTIDIEQWIKECDNCQKKQPALHISSEMKPIKVQEVWELLGVDLIGPLPTTPTGNKYILTATDYFSKWVEAFPLKTKTATEVASRLLCMYLRHGSSERVLSAQGREFVNQLEFTLPTESDYVGIMEKMQNKRAELQSQTKNIELAQEKQKEKYKKRVSERYKPCTFAEGQLVLMKNSRRSTRKGGILEPKFTGPYSISEINGKRVKLANASNVPLSRSYNIDMLRPYTPNSISNSSKDSIIVQESAAAVPAETPSEDMAAVKDGGSNTLQKLHAVWEKPARGHLEAIVSNTKLYDSSFQSLKPAQWIVDEVIDAYFGKLCLDRPNCIAFSAKVSSAIFLGNYRSSVFRFGCQEDLLLTTFYHVQVPFQNKETVLCPTNTGVHWILLVLKPSTMKILIYDSMPANLHTYNNLLVNWRAFLQAVKYPDYQLWELMVQSSPKQLDSYNCGIFCMLFADAYLSQQPVTVISNNFNDMESYRTKIAVDLIVIRHYALNACDGSIYHAFKQMRKRYFSKKVFIVLNVLVNNLGAASPKYRNYYTTSNQPIPMSLQSSIRQYAATISAINVPLTNTVVTFS